MIAITILTILAAMGATFIVTKSYLFENFRFYFSSSEKLSTLVSCPQCFGFWCGLVFALSNYNFTTASFWQSIDLSICVAFATSGLCYIINEFIENGNQSH